MASTCRAVVGVAGGCHLLTSAPRVPLQSLHQGGASEAGERCRGRAASGGAEPRRVGECAARADLGRVSFARMCEYARGRPHWIESEPRYCARVNATEGRRRRNSLARLDPLLPPALPRADPPWTPRGLNSAPPPSAPRPKRPPTPRLARQSQVGSAPLAPQHPDSQDMIPSKRIEGCARLVSQGPSCAAASRAWSSLSLFSPPQTPTASCIHGTALASSCCDALSRGQRSFHDAHPPHALRPNPSSHSSPRLVSLPHAPHRRNRSFVQATRALRRVERDRGARHRGRRSTVQERLQEGGSFQTCASQTPPFSRGCGVKADADIPSLTLPTGRVRGPPNSPERVPLGCE